MAPPVDLWLRLLAKMKYLQWLKEYEWELTPTETDCEGICRRRSRQIQHVIRLQQQTRAKLLEWCNQLNLFPLFMFDDMEME